VLERYIQLITRHGVTQGIFLEGGLSRDGRIQPAKTGLLDYIAGTARDPAFDRDIWFVPVAINYDRVLEDRSLIRELLDPELRLGRGRQLVNVAQYLELGGFIMATSAACASSLHAIGTGYDLIRLGRQEVMLCGGAEELHPTVTGSFDILYATSTNYNREPQKTPRPFDRERDGLVCGEGSGILILEEYGRAVARNAKIYAEILGYSTSGNGAHVSQSNRASMVHCMKEAMKDARIAPEEVDYINAHATATLQGDTEEAEAIREVFGDSVPVSSLKGHIGHTLGASGAIELIASLMMMERSVIYPTRNLDTVSPDCGGIYHITEKTGKKITTILKNGFAFGGINATLLCRRPGGAGKTNGGSR
jgi:3-oxoacyl-[acyl-carrier-protein] synthase II